VRERVPEPARISDRDAGCGELRLCAFDSGLRPFGLESGTMDFAVVAMMVSLNVNPVAALIAPGLTL
jgi:hypothetical protein